MTGQMGPTKRWHCSFKTSCQLASWRLAKSRMTTVTGAVGVRVNESERGHWMQHERKSQQVLVRECVCGFLRKVKTLRGTAIFCQTNNKWDRCPPVSKRRKGKSSDYALSQNTNSVLVYVNQLPFPSGTTLWRDIHVMSLVFRYAHTWASNVNLFSL